MNEVYLDIAITVTPEPSIRELLSYQLQARGFTGFLEEETTLHCFRPEKGWNEASLKELETFVGAYAPPLSLSGIHRVVNENWNRLWEESIVPVEVGEIFIIAPSWHPPAAAGGKLVITIDPKMSFGTGYHESTRLMLRLMERHGRMKASVLDVGTGTGVLAIAAVKLGAGRVIAVDNDEWSYLNAAENLGKNGCGGAVDLRLGSLEQVPERNMDLILANLTRNTILEMMPILLSKLAAAGTLICSGLLIEDRPAVEDAMRQGGCTVLSTLTEHEWIAVSARGR